MAPHDLPESEPRSTATESSTHLLTVQVAQSGLSCLRFSGTPFVVRDSANGVVATGTLPPPRNAASGSHGLFGDVMVSRSTISVPDSDFNKVAADGVSGSETFQKTDQRRWPGLLLSCAAEG